MTLDILGFGTKNLTLDLHEDGVLVMTLDRAAKRNALNADTIEELVTLFSAIPRAGVRAVVLAANTRGEVLAAADAAPPTSSRWSSRTPETLGQGSRSRDLANRPHEQLLAVA